MLRAARDWGVPPMQLVTGRDTGWCYRSRWLAIGLTRVDSTTGPEGYDVALETDEMSNGWWEPEIVVNEAVAARQRFMAEHGKKLEPGSTIVIRYAREGS